MNVVIRLPERIAVMRDMAYANRCSLNECMASYLCDENDSFSIWEYNHRCTPIAARKVACQFGNLFPRAWILPADVVSCDRIEVVGITLVLYNAKKI